jgi:flagellar basal body-associated protein FliL
MAEDEAREAQAEDEQKSSGPMISGKGWIIVALLVISEGILLGIPLWFSQSDSASETERLEGGVVREAASFNQYQVEFKDLTFTVMRSSQIATLSMNMGIVLGLTEEEREDPSVDPPSQEVMQAYVDAVGRMRPDILDELRSIINNMTYQQLTKPEGQAKIQNDIRLFVNRNLTHLTFKAGGAHRGKKRVEKVLLTQFVLQ